MERHTVPIFSFDKHLDRVTGEDCEFFCARLMNQPDAERAMSSIRTFLDFQRSDANSLLATGEIAY